MPYTGGGTYYRELGGSPTYNKTIDGAGATDTWMVPWHAAFGFANTVVPSEYKVGKMTIKPLGWGFRYAAGIYAESCDVSPWYSEEPGITGKSDASGWAKVKVSYKNPEEEEDEDDEDDPETFLTHKITIGAEMMTVPPRNVTLTDASLDPANTKVEDIMTDEDAPITILMPTAEHQFTWKRVISPPFSNIYDNIGKVNSGAFLGAAKETLMFLGCDAQREFTTSEAKPWTLDYRFSHRCAQPIGAPNPLTWNHFYVPKTGTWTKLRFNGELAYQSGNFMGLFS